MNRLMTFAAFVLAVPPVVALSQRAAFDGWKGRTVTIRTCVGPGIGSAIRLQEVTELTAGENATTAPVRAKRTVYWFYKPADMKDRAGQLIEVSALVAEATAGEVPLTAFDVVGELESSTPSPAVTSDLPETVTLKLEVSKIRHLSSGCK
jgi:hypothetical protein